MANPDPSSSGSSGSSLPDEIVQSIAIANAKSIGEQPAILSNLALANQILSTNLANQMALSQQQAMNQIIMATMAKCVSLIVNDKDQGDATKLVEELGQLINHSGQGPKPPAPHGHPPAT